MITYYFDGSIVQKHKFLEIERPKNLCAKYYKNSNKSCNFVEQIRPSGQYWNFLQFTAKLIL